jgi:MFS transporter, DHA1 family, tetracycline resistance protein
MPAVRHTQFIVIALTVLLSTIGFGVCLPVLPRYAESLHASELTNGLLIGVFSLMVMIASPLWGRLSDRIGRRPVLIISTLGSAAGYFIMGGAGSLIWLFVARIVDGASGGNISTAQAYIADITTPENRSRGMAGLGAAIGLGFVIGPAIGGVLSHWSLSAPFYFMAGLCIVNAIMVYTSLPESLSVEKRHASHTEAPLSEVYRHSDGPLFVNVAMCYFVCLIAFSIMTAVFTLFGGHRFQLDPEHVGYIMAEIGFIGVLIQGGALRRLLPKYGEVKLARFGLVCLFIAFILLPLTASMTTLVLVSSLIALGNSFVQPTLNGLASRAVEGPWQGRALGLLQSAASLGRGIGPVLGGVLLHMDVSKEGHPESYYGRTPFWAAAVFMVVALVLAAKLRIPNRTASTAPGSEAGIEPAAGV